MKKSQKERRKEVEKLLMQQKIRDVRQIEAYKLSICHPNSAGIDLGSSENYVALNPEIAAEMDLPTVHKFSTVTSGHKACRDLLLQCGIKEVCMESTGIYWINLHYLLTQAGINVCLVNPKMFRMVPGRKTDILDCQWLQTLHMYGLCRGSFIPLDHIRQLRTYMRERENTIRDRSRYVLRMQKALVQMNLMLVNVVNDVTGKTGMGIIKAIIAGERDPKALAAMRDGRCKHSEQEIEESLKGIYKEDQLFLLAQNCQKYEFMNRQIEELDKKIGQLLVTFPHVECREKKEPLAVGQDSQPSQTNPAKRKPRPSKNDLKAGIDLEQTLLDITGVDITSITGLQANAILQIISEVGTDMSLFPTEKHFVSYLGFAPRNKITGGVVISSKTDRKKSHAAQVFKKVIPAVSKGNSAMSCFYHRIAGRHGTGVAIVATARKLAISFYNTLRYGREYVEQGEVEYKKKIELREKDKLNALAKKYGMKLTPAA